jgi:xanthine dehydrogenase accessory factor
MREIFDRMSQLINQGKEMVLAIVVNAESSTAGKTGFKMLVLPDGKIYGTIGGGALEKDVIENSLELFKTRGVKYKRYVLKEGEESSLGMICGGETEIYMEYIGAKNQLVVFGAGHIGKMIYKLANDSQSYDVVVVDERDDFASRENFPDATIFCGAGIYDKVNTIPLRDDASVIIVTPGGEYDASILKGLYDSNIKFSYIGMIGSIGRRDKCFARARDVGVSEEFLDRVFTPVGLAIGGETPFEISIAIFGEIIALHKKALENVKTEKAFHSRNKH